MFDQLVLQVRHDAELIQSGLNNAVSDQGSRKVRMFICNSWYKSNILYQAPNKRIDLMKALYTRLCDALNLYATTNSLTINNPV